MWKIDIDREMNAHREIYKQMEYEAKVRNCRDNVNFGKNHFEILSFLFKDEDKTKLVKNKVAILESIKNVRTALDDIEKFAERLFPDDNI